MSRFEGKVAIVTGGAGGLGGATARLLAERGAHVIVTDVAEEPGAALASSIGGAFLRHDVTERDHWREVVELAASFTGRIDILVNAAGVEGDLSIAGLAVDPAEWRRVFAINLDGALFGCQAVMPVMKAAGRGAIVSISSIVSFMATPTALAYGASKAALEQLTRSVAILGAQDGARVRCNSVHPGVIRTRMTDSIIATFAAAQGIGTEQAEAAVCAAIPFGSRGEPEDVAALVAFLASDEAGYITGAAFRVDGGWSVTSAG